MFTSASSTCGSGSAASPSCCPGQSTPSSSSSPPPAADTPRWATREAPAGCSPADSPASRSAPTAWPSDYASSGSAPARSTALFGLATELPAALLARLLGIHISVAVAWQRASSGRRDRLRSRLQQTPARTGGHRRRHQTRPLLKGIPRVAISDSARTRRPGAKGAELHLMQHSALRVNTRCLRRSVRRCGAPRPAGAPCGYGDLGLHGPPGSDATMMRLMPLRGMHHRCACWHRDASGCSRLHRVHHRRSGERCPVGAAAARDASGLRIIGHVTRLTWQPAALVAPHASRARRQTSPQPPARPSATWHADAPSCRGRGRHGSQPPAGGCSLPGYLALLRNPGDPYGNHPPGSSLQGSPLRLRYSAWLVIRSLPVQGTSDRADDTPLSRDIRNCPMAAMCSAR